MSEASYEVWLIGVEPGEPDPAQGIATAFHIDRAHADALLDALPCCVKRTAVETEARSIAAGLAIAGGLVEVRGGDDVLRAGHDGEVPSPRSLPPLPTLDTEPRVARTPDLDRTPPGVVVGVYDRAVHGPLLPSVGATAATLVALVGRQADEQRVRVALGFANWTESRLVVPEGSRRARLLTLLERIALRSIPVRLEIAGWLVLSVVLLGLGLLIRRSFLIGLETPMGRIRDSLAIVAALKAVERGVAAVRETPAR